MKKLILYRHAKSDWSVSGQRDIERTLNKRGKSDAPLMAQIINKMLDDESILILCSIAKRTRETLKPLSERLSSKIPVVFEEGLYESGGASYIQILKTVSPKYDTVIVIGHNPSIEECTDYLAGGEDTYSVVSVPTATVILMEIPVNNWKNIGGGMASVKSVITPKMLRKIAG